MTMQREIDPQRADLTAALAALEAEQFERVPDPAVDTRVGDIIHEPDEAWGGRVGIAEKSGPGYYRLYATTTGEPRDILGSLLEATLKKKNNDEAYPEVLGKPAFSRKPIRPYVLGMHKCRLHRSRPEWPLYASWGLKPCGSEHFPSEYEVTRHMQMDHKAEWAAIKEHEETERRDRERREQNDILMKLAERVATGPMPAPVAETAPPSTPSPTTAAALMVAAAETTVDVSVPKARKSAETTAAELTTQCERCQVEIRDKNRFGLDSKMKAHERMAHGKLTPGPGLGLSART